MQIRMTMKMRIRMKMRMVMFVFFKWQILQIYCCYSSSIAFVFVVQRSETRNNSSPELSSQWHAAPNESSRRADTSRSFLQAV